ncbi:MAG TPA: acyl-CoA dehydrogenase family protein, partial [Bdellovibrionota bacterium]|nr:acyl-CoA dehydrogenase family protein [Bdellovibrionota bacterium]
GIIMFGTEEQKKRLLPDLATGKKIAGFALTEPAAGSDAFSIKTRAVRKDNIWVLNGQKIWITNGGIGHVYTVFAKTEVEVKGKKEDRVTAFIVERGMEGFTSGKEEEKMGIRGSSTTSLFFSDVKIPKENVLGEVGKGFKYAMEILNTGRLGLAAGAVGGCRTLTTLSIEEAKRRQQFNRPIIGFGMVKEKLAHMILDTYALESVTYLTAGLIDKKVKDYSIESAICKILGGEGIWDTIDETIQIHGGNGYMADLPLERVCRDARIFRIFEGTNEILHLFIALAGMQSPGEKLAEVAKAMKDPIKSVGVLSDFAIQWVKRRSLGGDTVTKAHPLLKREATHTEDFTLALAKAVESLLLRHGKEIIEKQFAQHRIATWVINLFVMFAVISRATKRLEEVGEERAKADLVIAQSVCSRASKRIRSVMKAMDYNDDEQLKEIVAMGDEKSGYPAEVPL